MSRLTVILPMFNEAQYVEAVISETANYFRAKNFDFDIIAIDDGSTDQTGEKLRRVGPAYPLSVISLPQNQGKGAAVRRGILAAKGEFLFFLDADLATPVSEFDKFIPHMNRRADIVIGSRRIKESDIVVHQSKLREFMGEIFYQAVYALLSNDVRDTNCGFKLFRREVGQRLFRLSRIDRWGFDAEILFLARHLGYAIKEIPVRWFNKPTTKVHLVSAVTGTIGELIRIKMNHVMGRYSS
ncbi:MAG: glycosyltransferase family 2 protein [Elusimicrobia bacterium]|nr:glycosyltransferase family 2 protein [Elusimicrobiota bacterium]